MAVPADQLDDVLSQLEGRTPVAAVVGRVVDGPAGTIRIG